MRNDLNTSQGFKFGVGFFLAGALVLLVIYLMLAWAEKEHYNELEWEQRHEIWATREHEEWLKDRREDFERIIR